MSKKNMKQAKYGWVTPVTQTRVLLTLAFSCLGDGNRCNPSAKYVKVMPENSF